MLEIELKQFKKGKELYRSVNLKIEEGITCLIGPNGSGKTYACSQLNTYIQEELCKEVLYIDLVQENLMDATGSKEHKSYGKWMVASEGQRVYDNLIDTYAEKIGNLVTTCSEKRTTLCLIIDGADSRIKYRYDNAD